MTIVKGYKATDENMQCRGFQFELGKWFEHEGPLKLCESGFHFCKYPSGVWNYYNTPKTRVFEVEAEEVADTPIEAGADVKLVARKIRFVREVVIGGDRNTGDRNTGHNNTGDWNTGHRNTGDWNATNYSAGMFCIKEPLVISFDKQTKLTRDKYFEKYPEVYTLGDLLLRDKAIEFELFKNIPGITKAKLKALHKKHLEGRKK
jgi:hypothetical protein